MFAPPGVLRMPGALPARHAAVGASGNNAQGKHTLADAKLILPLLGAEMPRQCTPSSAASSCVVLPQVHAYRQSVARGKSHAEARPRKSALAETVSQSRAAADAPCKAGYERHPSAAHVHRITCLDQIASSAACSQLAASIQAAGRSPAGLTAGLQSADDRRHQHPTVARCLASCDPTTKYSAVGATPQVESNEQSASVGQQKVQAARVHETAAQRHGVAAVPEHAQSCCSRDASPLPLQTSSMQRSEVDFYARQLAARRQRALERLAALRWSGDAATWVPCKTRARGPELGGTEHERIGYIQSLNPASV